MSILIAPTPSPAEDAPKVLRLEENLAHGELQVIGEAENVHLPEFNVTWPARIDTGATTTSIHATKIEDFERDGNPWVRFHITNDEAGIDIEAQRKVARIAKIKKRGDEDYHERYVVVMDLKIGDVERRIEVNLADRTGFEFPVLIGRNYLEDTALVDVSRAYIQDTYTPAE
ncbi:MAG: RimK/LysX family protein [Mangrovicoccus sp.]|nr:RimK/LysX family protein [Mangrovicoccus sp.]